METVQESLTSNFCDYSFIVDQYISTWNNEKSVFQYIIEDKINPEFKKLDEFLKILGVDRYFSIVETITKTMLSARFSTVFGYRYPDFKNVIHLILDIKPEFWKHFKLVIKIYGHAELLSEIIKDPKIQKKINLKKEMIDNPNHEYNNYIEFLCPKFDGRLIGWGNGENLNDVNFQKNKSSYPTIVFKKLLNSDPKIDDGNVSEIMDLLKRYIYFMLKNNENINYSIWSVIFDYIIRNNICGNNGFMQKFCTEYNSDEKFKELFDPIIDFFELHTLIKDVNFVNNNFRLVFYEKDTLISDIESMCFYYDKMEIIRRASDYIVERMNKIYEDDAGGYTVEFFY